MDDEPLSGKQRSFNPRLVYSIVSAAIIGSFIGVSVNAIVNTADVVVPKKETSQLERILNQKKNKSFFKHENWLASTFSERDYNSAEILKTANWCGGNLIYLSADISKKSLNNSNYILDKYKGNNAYVSFNIDSIDDLNEIKPLFSEIKKEYNGIIISGLELGNIEKNQQDKKRYLKFEENAKIYGLSVDICSRFVKNSSVESPEKDINPSRTYFISSYHLINHLL